MPSISSLLPARESRFAPKIFRRSTADHCDGSLQEPLPSPVERKFAREKEQKALDLRRLNDCLYVLTEVFPNVQKEVFREMLSELGPQSRVEIVTDRLLRNGHSWIKGRHVIPDREPPRLRHHSSIKDHANANSVNQRLGMFRSQEYKLAVSTSLQREFGLRAVGAVMAEHNSSYCQTRTALFDLKSKSWKSTISDILFRRKKLVLETPCPFLTLRADGRPMLRPSGNPELDEELNLFYLQPLEATWRLNQEERDYALAKGVNQDEAIAADALYDCLCCYADCTFEELVTCTEADHLVCLSCVRRTVHEAVYGQGWSRAVDLQQLLLRCIVPADSGKEDCHGYISYEAMERSFAGERNGRATLERISDRFADAALKASGLSVVRCPFCGYAEADDNISPSNSRIRRSPAATIALIMLVIGLVITQIVTLFATGHSCAYLSNPESWMTLSSFEKALLTMQAHALSKRRTSKFICRSPTCGVTTCLHCHKIWRDIHICYESEKQLLRSVVERAMVDAVKRTCPACNLSFVKASGCNKLTCICGYQMCYVCRQEIREEKYAHFCQHFRPEPGTPCRECNKCDLYQAEDEDAVIKEAARRAEREWRAANEGGGASDSRNGAGRSAVGSRTFDWHWTDDISRVQKRSIHAADKSSQHFNPNIGSWKAALEAFVDYLVLTAFEFDEVN